MRRPAVISLYSGAGGLDYGFESAGFRTAVAVEFDRDCCNTLRHNRRWAVIERSIFDVPTEAMLAAGKLRRGEVALVIGGPPCQPFSKSGYWIRGDSRRLGDPRADTLAAYMRVVEEALPEAFLLENVSGLAFSGKDEGLRLLLDRIDRINRKTGTRYRPHYQVISAAKYGVPQIRERFIMVASRDGLPFEFPQPRFDGPRPGELPGLSLPPFRTAWDAIADVRPEPGEDLVVTGRWGELLPSVPEGRNYLWHTARGGGLPLFGWRRRYWGFLLKLAKHLPSWTLQAQPGSAIGPFHWENRRLSRRELCRLQTFPDDIEVLGGRTAIQRQLGNAVPSLLAEVLGRAIGTQFFGRRYRGDPHLLPPDRSPPPQAEPVARVPSYYLSLRGEHAPHPGTGKGDGALARAGPASVNSIAPAPHSGTAGASPYRPPSEHELPSPARMAGRGP